MELGNRESHLLSGLGIQIIAIGLLVFPYTQALRQVNYNRELAVKLREQVASSRQEVERYGRVDLEKLRAEFLGPWESQVPTVDQMPAWGERFESFARNEFGLGLLETRVGASPERSVKVPIAGGRGSVELQLYGLELSGTGTTRNFARFLESLRRSEVPLLYIIKSVKLRIGDPGKVSAVQFRVRWLVATRKGTQKFQPLPSFTPKRAELDWGPREESFLSVVTRSELVKPPAELAGKFRLDGISWEPDKQSCVVNNITYQPGDLLVDGWRIVVIAPTGILIENRGSEHFLPFFSNEKS